MNVRTARFGAVLTKLACLMDVETAVSMLTVGEVFTLTKLNRENINPYKRAVYLFIVFTF
jgi:hypothetical protein